MSDLEAAREGEPINAEEPALDKPTNQRTPSRVRKFFNAYAECGSVKAAAKVAGIHRSRHYQKLKTDAGYRNAFEAIEDQIGQELEDLAVERVRNGIQRQLFWRGKPIRQNGRLVYETEYDTQLHVTMLKRFRPKLYREHVTQELSGTINLNLADRLTAAVERVRLMRRNDSTTTERAG